MPSYHVSQHLKTTPTQPATLFRNDSVLETPVLDSPGDGANLCKDVDSDDQPLTFTQGSLTGIVLKWNSVPNVTSPTGFFVVQWGNNSSLSGPTTRGRKISAPTTELELKFLDDIRMGEEIFWRVFAFNTTGGASAKSETRSLIFDCEDKDGNLGSDGTESVCEFFDVEIEIDGPDTVKCGSKNLYGLNLKFNCITEDGTLINELNVVWDLFQTGDLHTIVQQDRNLAVIESKDVSGKTTEDLLSEKFTLRATVNFQIGSDLFPPPEDLFFCFRDKSITADCDAIDERVGYYMIVGKLYEPMRRKDCVYMDTHYGWDCEGGLLDPTGYQNQIVDIGQIPSDIELYVENVVTGWVSTEDYPALLISFDCEYTYPV